MSQPTEPIALTLSFSPHAAGATLTWEADVLGVRQSQLVSPYQGADLALAIGALDVLQYPNYPLPQTELQRQRFSFSAAQQARLQDLELWDQAGRVHPAAHQRVGRALYRVLAADQDAAAALDTVRNHAAALGAPLALRLRFPPGAVELAALPWELLWDAGPAPLLLSRGRPAACTRHLDLPQALLPAQQRSGPLQVLAIAPNAGIAAAVRNAERAARLAAWQPLIDSGQLMLREIRPATRRALVDALHDNAAPDIVHYYGHGRYRDGAGALLLDAPDGGFDWTSASTLMTLLGQVRLVTLCACQGAMIASSEHGLLSGVAPALSAAGAPLVIGMQLTTRADAAARAAGVIYRALVAGQAIQDAVSQARQALFVEERDQASWYLPALYIRSRETGLAYLRAPAAPAAAPAGCKQLIVATKKSTVRNVRMEGGPGANQQVIASDQSNIDTARLKATRASQQELRAEEEGEISGAELDDTAG